MRGCQSKHEQHLQKESGKRVTVNNEGVASLRCRVLFHSAGTRGAAGRGPVSSFPAKYSVSLAKSISVVCWSRLILVLLVLLLLAAYGM